ncbi:MAG: Trk system potassium transporter TrkA [Spirochaetales bacterium]|nr:Trk system potassium transporter TrkA [Spirochaetales bacterium]
MKIVIVGAGNVGYSIAQSLSIEGHDIVVIESQEELAQRLENELDVQIVLGNGSRPSVLAEAGIVEGSQVDYLIACSNRDEVNIMACWQAKHMGVRRVISRAKSLEYTEAPEWLKVLGIDEMISPERTVARDIESMLWVNAAIHSTDFFSGNAVSYAFRVNKESPICGKSLKQIADSFDEFKAVFVFVERGESGFIPSGDWIAQDGDLCYLITFKKLSSSIEALFNTQSVKKIRKIMIVGGGKIGTFLVRRLLRNHPGVDIKVIDKDYETCSQLAVEFPQISVLHGDGADERMLNHEGVDTVDGFVTATGTDELNLILAVLGKKLGAGKNIALVRSKTFYRVAKELPLDAVINPNESLSSVILRYIRYPESAGSLTLLESINSEILEITIPEGSPGVGRSISSLNIPRGVIFAMIKRGGKFLLPNGTTTLETRDVILIFSNREKMNKTLKQLGIKI